MILASTARQVLPLKRREGERRRSRRVNEEKRERERGKVSPVGENEKIPLKIRDGARSHSLNVIEGTLMSRAIHLPSPCNERSRGERGVEGRVQRLHVALPHYAAVRRGLCGGCRGLGSPQPAQGATIPAWTPANGRPCHAIIPPLLTRASWTFDIISLLKS